MTPAESEQKRRYYERNRERILAKQRAEREANPEINRERCRQQFQRHKAKRLAACKEWVEANPEKARGYARDWARRQREAGAPQWRELSPEHRERARELVRKRQAALPPEKKAARADYQRKRRALKAGVLAEDVDRTVVYERDEGICGICREQVDPANWHLDHIVPIARGGEHSYANTQVTHPSCNLRKGAKVPSPA